MYRPLNKRRIVLDLAVTLDGFIEGPNGEIDWCIMDDDMGFKEFLNDIDTILYGRKSYELWGSYSPTDKTSDMEKEIWALIDEKQKYVFSNTITSLNGKAKLINNNIEEEIKKMKNEPGKDIWLYGGANLITTFINLGLIDEYRLAIHPVILGAGKPLFTDIDKKLGLTLSSIKRFSSGVVQLSYHPVK